MRGNCRRSRQPTRRAHTVPVSGEPRPADRGLGGVWAHDRRSPGGRRGAADQGWLRHLRRRVRQHHEALQVAFPDQRLEGPSRGRARAARPLREGPAGDRDRDHGFARQRAARRGSVDRPSRSGSTTLIRWPSRRGACGDLFQLGHAQDFQHGRDQSSDRVLPLEPADGRERRKRADLPPLRGGPRHQAADPRPP